MFGFSPSLADLESKCTELTEALAAATTDLRAAEAADTEQGSAATWKALLAAREQHDRALRRQDAARCKLDTERARVTAAETLAQREEHDRLKAKLAHPSASYLEDEIAELAKLDLVLEALIDRFEAKKAEHRNDLSRCRVLASALGLDLTELNFGTYFEPINHAQRALSIARQTRRENAFEAGDTTDRRRQHEWLMAAPAAVAPGL